MNSGHKQTDVIVMDFAKAFDKVPHKRLLYKLDFYGIRGSTHKWIDSWLSERSQKVELDGRASDPVPVLSPGGGGGTLIFCGYIGEAPASTPKPQKLLRFADHPKKIPVLSGIPKKILELLAYPKKLRIHLFYAY